MVSSSALGTINLYTLTEQHVQDPLNLLPLLIPSDNAAASNMIRLISQEGSAKESAIAVQEAFERLKESEIDIGQTTGSRNAIELLRLIEVCENGEELTVLAICHMNSHFFKALPRLKLRKKGPVETLEPILNHLTAVIETIAPSSTLGNGRLIISSVSRLINAVKPWLSQNNNNNEQEYKTGIARSSLYLLS